MTCLSQLSKYQALLSRAAPDLHPHLSMVKDEAGQSLYELSLPLVGSSILSPEALERCLMPGQDALLLIRLDEILWAMIRKATLARKKLAEALTANGTEAKGPAPEDVSS